MPVRAAGARRRPSQAVSAALILFAFVLAALWVALPLLKQDPQPAPFSRLVREAGADPGRAEAAAREIVARGDEGLAELVPALAHGMFVDGEAVDDAARAILESALPLMDPRALVSFLESTAPERDAAVRAEALRIVGTYGLAEGVDALLDIACGRSAADLEESGDALESSLLLLIAREPEALEYLPGAWARAPELAFGNMVRAAGRCGRARALPVLTGALGRVPSYDGLLLAEIGRLGDAADPESARAAALRVADYLDSQYASLGKAAVNALGRLGAPESVPELVELLGAEDAGLARTAYAALQRVTGLRLRGEPGPWRAWLANEEGWLDLHLSSALTGLEASDAATVREALRELERHPLDRHVLSEEAARVLERDEPELRIAACETLKRLGSRAALPALIDALEDEPDVAEAARTALVLLTGEELGAEREPWEAALEARR